MLDESGRLHCADGAAISYPDGFSIWAWHGLRVKQQIIERPDLITVSQIETETNAEICRVLIERYGQDKYLLDSGAKQIHSDDYGTLFRKDISNDEPLVMVKVVNSTPEPDGSFHDYFLRVPPTMKTARESVAWTFGKVVDEYSPSVQT
jgi:hypothetical protein